MAIQFKIRSSVNFNSIAINGRASIANLRAQHQLRLNFSTAGDWRWTSAATPSRLNQTPSLAPRHQNPDSQKPDSIRIRVRVDFLFRNPHDLLCKDPSLPSDLRKENRFELSKLPRNSSFTRVRNRCFSPFFANSHFTGIHLISRQALPRHPNPDLAPIASNDPILSWVWSFIATVQMGQLPYRIEVANELASLAQDNDRNKKIIVDEGGVSLLLKLLKESSSSDA